jgi:hypothetical protein
VEGRATLELHPGLGLHAGECSAVLQFLHGGNNYQLTSSNVSTITQQARKRICTNHRADGRVTPTSHQSNTGWQMQGYLTLTRKQTRASSREGLQPAIDTNWC